MSSRIATTYRLDIEVLSPLHIGSGRKLIEGFEYARHGGKIYRLNVDRILEDRWSDDPRQQEKILTQQPATLLLADDYTQHPDYFVYSLVGTPSLREVIECARDVQGRAYLPGSSLKGAIRTALLRAMIEGEKTIIRRGDIGYAGGPREAVRADDRIEAEWLGENPNRDLLRAVIVADSAPLPTNALNLQRVQMAPKLDVDVEAIRVGTQLTATLKIDTWLLEQRTSDIHWKDGRRQIVHNLSREAMRIAGKRIAHEYEYHQNRKEAGPANFYGRLANAMIDGQPKNEFFIQVGYATGWRGKSVLGNLPNDSELLETVVHDFELDRGGGRQSRGYTRGQPFPKARHLAYINNERPALPMGWLRVKMTEV